MEFYRIASGLIKKKKKNIQGKLQWKIIKLIKI